MREPEDTTRPYNIKLNGGKEVYNFFYGTVVNRINHDWETGNASAESAWASVLMQLNREIYRNILAGVPDFTDIEIVAPWFVWKRVHDDMGRRCDDIRIGDHQFLTELGTLQVHIAQIICP